MRIFFNWKSLLLFVPFLTGGMAGAFAAEMPLKKVFKAGPFVVSTPAFSNVANIKGDTYGTKELLKQGITKDLFSVDGDNVSDFNGSLDGRWKSEALKKGSLAVPENGNDDMVGYALFFIDAEGFAKGTIKVTSPLMLEVFVDGAKVADKYINESKASDATTAKASFSFTRRQHQVLVKYLIPRFGIDSAFVAIKVEVPEKQLAYLSSSTSKRMLTINDILEGVKVGNTSIAPSGRYAKVNFSKIDPANGRNSYFSKIYDVVAAKEVLVPGDAASGDWMPNGSRLYWINATLDNTLFVYDIEKNTVEQLASHLPTKDRVEWAPNERFFVYADDDGVKVEEKGPMIQIVSPEDRQPGWRSRTFLYKYDLATGVVARMTYGNKSSYLSNISSDSKSAIVTVHSEVYNERPFSVTNIYRLNTANNAVDTILANQKFIGSVELSPDGSTLLVVGGPEAFKGLGVNLKKQPIANSYDNQLYLYSLATKVAEPITKNFDPAIDKATWSADGKRIVLMASKGDRNLLYSYSLADKQFSEIPITCDVVTSFDISKQGDRLVYYGQSGNFPSIAYSVDLATGQNTVLANPAKEKMSQIGLGVMQDWNFKAKDGSTIEGRYYLPANFDATKKYPMIVNYYGGTTPVERNFESRYPLHLYAAMGYIVYVLQPSGAIGYGQEFSARHVNGWGKLTADEIIEGTKKFIAEHSFVDASKVGCIGASYGGFMTMYLQTHTDIFATAISHAGISDITSYWGEGYWGYTYSSGASANSYPWNNQALYVKQSPLFSADKVKTPILFLHGQQDTNVPIGESIQMYNALKILGKEAEFITVQGENHTILGYKARIAWNNTIFAWFAKYLQGDDSWWKELYPVKNL